ncbi:cytochrome c biogenesis CcdA family protein [Cohnella algarum]|uniref:cytochrome c biogenesis CcdA family protein n=1 Tax=Cohnella algarum TaxID=2044859 RepID=UPI0019673C36|nr:cytochrome c biogenesis protein CcdA [Cohnella algarum]MBN2982286.1 cytochrome c biogenesis protein CcdA [Cohnella algarum]
MDNLSVFAAFAAGMLSFLSPCVFPLIPAYVSHLTGSSFQDGKLVVYRGKLIVQSLSFIVGFSLVFIAMGASASFIGRFFAQERDLIQKISGLLIIVFGLQMVGLFNLRLLMSGKTWEINTNRSRGAIRSLLTGVAFGAGWSPCVGLALSSILLLAGSAETLWNGIGLLAVYSLGLGVPFLLISWLLTYSMKIMKKMNRWIPLLSKLNGWLLIGLGFLLFTGQLQKISAWLSQYTFWEINF